MLYRQFVMEISEFCESGGVADMSCLHGAVHLITTLAGQGKAQTGGHNSSKYTCLSQKIKYKTI